MHADVSLLKCPEYDPAALDEAMERAAALAGMPGLGGKTVLVKPNILNASTAAKAVTTNPAFVAAAIRFLKRKGAKRILVGDSPAWQGSAACAKTAGIFDAALAEGAEWADFQPGPVRENPDGKEVKHFTLAAVLDEVDFVLNLPKLKTHRLMRYTGAIKNLFGLIPGMAKAGMHLRLPDRPAFGRMLVDLAGTVGPCFTIMDAIVSMEGEGPSAGKPVKTGLVLASGDLAALDWIAASLIGYDPAEIPYLADALERTGRKTANPAISVAGLDPKACRISGFDLVKVESMQAAFMSMAPGFVRNLTRRFTISRPVFDPAICVGCSGCVRICPAKALELGKHGRNRNLVRIDDEACILCYCCHEICPAKAISLSRVMRRPAHARHVSAHRPRHPASGGEAK